MVNVAMSNQNDFATGYAAELEAMGAIMAALVKLPPDAQASVVRWVVDKLDLKLVADEVEVERKDRRNYSGSGAEPHSQISQIRAGTINTVAAKIQASSCRTILIAAALYLVLFQGREVFSRSELVAQAKSAKIWKSDYVNQTSTMISRLADAGTIVEKSKDLFYLSDQAIAEFSPSLGGASES